MLLILQYLKSFNFFALFSFFTYLIVLILHILCTICHLNHYLLNLFKLNLSYFSHRLLVVFLKGCIISTSHLKHFVASVSDINLCLLATFQSFSRLLIRLLFISVNKSWKFRSSSVIASMILFSQFIPFSFLGNFINCILFVFDSGK